MCLLLAAEKAHTLTCPALPKFISKISAPRHAEVSFSVPIESTGIIDSWLSLDSSLWTGLMQLLYITHFLYIRLLCRIQKVDLRFIYFHLSFKDLQSGPGFAYTLIKLMQCLESLYIPLCSTTVWKLVIIGAVELLLQSFHSKNLRAVARGAPARLQKGAPNHWWPPLWRAGFNDRTSCISLYVLSGIVTTTICCTYQNYTMWWSAEFDFQPATLPACMVLHGSSWCLLNWRPASRTLRNAGRSCIAPRINRSHRRRQKRGQEASHALACGVCPRKPSTEKPKLPARASRPTEALCLCSLYRSTTH